MRQDGGITGCCIVVAVAKADAAPVLIALFDTAASILPPAYRRSDAPLAGGCGLTKYPHFSYVTAPWWAPAQ